MKGTKNRSTVKLIARIGFGILVGFAWALAVFLLLYTVIAGVLPGILFVAVGALPISLTNTADIVVFGGGVTTAVVVLVCLLLWKILCRMFSFAKKAHRSLCSRWHLIEESEQETEVMKKGVANKKKPMSKRASLILLVAIFAALVLLVWGVPKLVNTMEGSSVDTEVSESSDNLISDSQMNAENGAISYPTVESAGLLDAVNTINFTVWNEADFDTVLDGIETVVRDVQTADSYDTHMRIGFQTEDDVSVIGEDLLTLVGADITASDVANLISDIAQSNGVFYDMTFVRALSENNMVSFMERNGNVGTDVIFDGSYVYVENTDETAEYAYTAQAVEKDSVLMDYAVPANLLFTVIQPSLVSFSVDTDDVAAYVQDNEYGTSYMYRMTESLSRGNYDYVTKTVLMECVGDGAYETTIVYMLEGAEEEGLLVINIDTDVTDVTVDIPAAEQVYFVPAEK